jgi:hypothetical protein
VQGDLHHAVTAIKPVVSKYTKPTVYLYYVDLQPPLSGIEALSRQDALATYGKTVRELSLQLHLYKANASNEPAAAGLNGGFSGQEESWRLSPLQRMKTAVMQHMHWLLCVSCAGKVELPLAL